MVKEEGKDLYFETVDFLGNKIYCTLEQWKGHIVENRRHADMEGQEDLIILALQKPETGIRYHDIDYPNRMSYYGTGEVTRYLKVSVEFSDANCTGIGYIKTAFPLNNMKPKEKPEFPKK